MGDGFLNVTPTTQVIKEKINERDFIKIEDFVLLVKASRKGKDNYRIEKIFTNHVSEKGLLSQIYTKFLNFIIKRQWPN